jgi:hypothetical protein
MAGSATLTHYEIGRVRRIVVDWVADAADATVPSVVLPRIEGRLFELHTNPGATAPTDNYDITLTDAESIDRLQGVGANRDTVNTEQAVVVYSGSTIHPVVSRTDVLTLNIGGNAVNSALGRVILLYGPA